MTEEKIQENKTKKTSLGKEKKFDSKGEIDRVLTENEKCANRFNELLRMFNIMVVGREQTTLYTPGLGKKKGLTFSDHCADLQILKSWIRQKVNNV